MFSVFRSPKNPFLTPTRTRSFEAIGAFNPSVVEKDGITHVFYRAMAEPDHLRTPGRGFSTIGYAHSKDGGETFENRKQIILAKETWEAYGCEDPRATFFEGKWYVFYTALGGFPFTADNIRTAVAVGLEPDNLTEKHLMAPFNAKAATLFPERINGDAVLLITAHTDRTDDHPFPTIGIARSKNVSDFWDPAFWIEWHNHLSDHAFPDVRRGDHDHMEVGATPLLIEQGWLVVYSHIQHYYDESRRIFGVEALLLDRNDPLKIIAKTEFPFLVPEESYERYGLVSNIVFPTGAHLKGDTLNVYYGGADTVCAMAQLSLSDLLSSMDPEQRDNFVERASDQPILSPIPDHKWESSGVSNAAAVDLDGSVHLVYRATDSDNFSHMGYARLEDGLHVDERLSDPVYGPRESFESHGTEDPRLTVIEDMVYLAYTAFDGSFARGAISSIPVKSFLAKDFNWTKPFALTPEGVNDKDLCILPELIKGEALIMHRIDPNICAELFPGLPPIRGTQSCTEIMAPRPGMWDATKIGAAAPPIRVEEGWLFIYHAVGADFAYRLGAVLLDAETATTVIARTNAPIFSPVLKWEKEGNVNNVIFSCGVILRDDTLFIYYGGADTAIGVATLSKKKLVARLLPSL
jgi:beta-1,2-mannobiose phosphorylase / 1,2-beta-oligomannan phosphorylase